jgi:hypothetical protein
MFRYWQDVFVDWLNALELWAWLVIRQATVGATHASPAQDAAEEPPSEEPEPFLVEVVVDEDADGALDHAHG